jgi:hypothetical protein
MTARDQTGSKLAQANRARRQVNQSVTGDGADLGQLYLIRLRGKRSASVLTVTQAATWCEGRLQASFHY